MTDKHPLTPDEISAIVDGLDPIDWTQMELLAKLPPSQRILPMVNATLMLRAGLRASFVTKFPELSMSEINMKVLAYLTPIKMKKYGSV